MQIAASKRRYIDCDNISKGDKGLQFRARRMRYVLARIRMIWGALMLAERRSLMVNGRTEMLVVSMRVRGGQSHGGVVEGRR